MAQGSAQVPTGGSESATTFAGQVNTALLAVLSRHSGATAPANGPNSAAVQYQDWMDTTNASFPVDRVNDGANWDRVFTVDVANSVVCPQLGGGLSTIASAATCDIGSKPGTLVTITGSTTITSFGSSAKNGEEKKVYCGGQFQITNSANIVCPGGQNIVTTTGDIFTAIYDGAGVWLIYAYQKSSAGLGIGLPTGAEFFMYGTGVVPGTARANGATIGNTGSGGTEGTGPAYFNLYTKLWNESAAGDTEIVISSGRGANAAADWAALKTITLPDMSGRVPVGLDLSASGRITNATMSPNGTTCGAVGGAQQVTLTTSNMPAHNHTGSSITNQTHTHSGTVTGGNVMNNNGGGGLNAGSGAQFATGAFTTDGGNLNLTLNIASQGGGAAHLNMQPSKAGTWYIVL